MDSLSWIGLVNGDDRADHASNAHDTLVGDDETETKERGCSVAHVADEIKRLLLGILGGIERLLEEDEIDDDRGKQSHQPPLGRPITDRLRVPAESLLQSEDRLEPRAIVKEEPARIAKRSHCVTSIAVCESRAFDRDRRWEEGRTHRC